MDGGATSPCMLGVAALVRGVSRAGVLSLGGSGSRTPHPPPRGGHTPAQLLWARPGELRWGLWHRVWAGGQGGEYTHQGLWFCPWLPAGSPVDVGAWGPTRCVYRRSPCQRGLCPGLWLTQSPFPAVPGHARLCTAPPGSLARRLPQVCSRTCLSALAGGPPGGPCERENRPAAGGVAGSPLLPEPWARSKRSPNTSHPRRRQRRRVWQRRRVCRGECRRTLSLASCRGWERGPGSEHLGVGALPNKPEGVCLVALWPSEVP